MYTNFSWTGRGWLRVCEGSAKEETTRNDRQNQHEQQN